VYFAFIMPGAIGIYIIASSLFAMIQDIILTKRYTKIMEIEDAARLEAQRIKEAELEAKRLETERKKAENKTELNPNTSKKKQQKVEKIEQLEKAAEWEKKHQPPATADDPSRSGARRYARGRAYDPARYDNVEAAGEDRTEEDSPEVEAAVLPAVTDQYENENMEETGEVLGEAAEDESAMDEDEEVK
jgi:YidC/Oxa1 family membrane protein insertase